MAASPGSYANDRDGRIEFTVDTEELSTTESVLTATRIMVMAGIDPVTHFLTEIEGRQQISFEGRPDEPIPMHEDMVFISAKVGPTPVS
jgi:hypothetical protein